MNYALTPIPDTPLLRVDFLYLGSQWLQEHPLQARYAFTQLKEGTASYPAAELAERLDFYGATVTTACNLSYASVTLHCLRKHFESVFPYVRSMLVEPLYSQQQLDIALSQGRTAWQIQHQKVDGLCKEELYRRLFFVFHPMGCFPALADYDTLVPDLLHRYHHQHIQSSSLSVLVTGNYDDALLDILRSGQEVTVDDSTPISSIYEQKPVQTSTERHISIDSHLPRVQAAVYLGCLLPPPSHPDMPLLRLASTLLGGYFGSRLMSNIRERRGLTYGINSTIFNIPYNNALVIACETSTQHAEEVVSEVKRELQRLCDDLVGDDELQMVKNYMEGKSCRRNERSFNYPQVLMNLIATGRTPDDLVANRRRQQAATPADIQRIARQYLSPERFVSCIVC